MPCEGTDADAEREGSGAIRIRDRASRARNFSVGLSSYILIKAGSFTAMPVQFAKPSKQQALDPA